MKLSLNYLQVLCIIGIIVVWYGERTYPYATISKCRWSEQINDPSTKLALIADPQLVDDNTYQGRNGILLGITEYIVDRYLKRNWVYLNQALEPQYNIFLGDLFDGGREWDDDKWKAEYVRWTQIFNPIGDAVNIQNVPGNHDIGYGDNIVKPALERFQQYFGPANTVLDVGEFTIVLLDTISLTNINRPDIFQVPTEFLDNIGVPVKPRILISHVPLYRDASESCGSDRESSNPIGYTKGYQYVTQVNPSLTKKILQAIEPVIVFSGDDHDACHVIHNYKTSDNHEKSANEFTVKSFSMAMGIRKPAIQLITLGNSQSEQNLVTNICMMPSPFFAFGIYGIYSIFALVILTIYNVFPYNIPRFMEPFLQGLLIPVERHLPIYESVTRTRQQKYSRGMTKKTLKEASIVAFVLLAFYIFLGWSMYF